MKYIQNVNVFAKLEDDGKGRFLSHDFINPFYQSFGLKG
jgi:hypothetical protein